MRLRSFPIAFALAVSACDLSSVRKEPVVELKLPAPSEYPNAAAVALLNDVRWHVTRVPDANTFSTLHEVHRIIAVLQQAGLVYATFDVGDSSWNIAATRVRVTLPSGEVRQVQPELVAATTADGKRIMTIPDVTVGSIVDYSVLLQAKGAMSFYTARVALPIPTKHYHAALDFPSSFSAQIKFYNSENVFPLKKGDGTTRGQLDLNDVPAGVSEPLAPAWPLVDPWWAYRFVDGPGAQAGGDGAGSTWPAALSRVARQLNDPALTAGASLDVPRSESCDRACVVQSALNVARVRAPLSGFIANGIGHPRPLRDVLASGQANSVEKAILVHAFLDHAGVRSSFVLAARDPTHDPDPLFSLPGRFDHVALVLDPRDGVAEATIVDPSCEYCRLGDIPTWLEGAGTLTLRTAPPPLDVEVGRITRTASRVREVSRTFDAQLAPDGTMSGSFTETHLGSAAVEATQQSRQHLLAYWPKNLPPEIRAHVKPGPDALKATPCDRYEARCWVAAGFVWAGYAQVEGDQMFVPLALLSSRYDAFKADAPRKNPIVIAHGEREGEIFTLHVPPGYVVANLPTGTQWTSPVLDALFEVHSTPTTITIRRQIELHPSVSRPEVYDELMSMLRAFAAVTQLRLELHKK